MSSPNIKGLSLDALIDLRERINNEIGGMAVKRRAELEAQLARLEGRSDRAEPKKAARGKSLKGRKVPPKYRNPADSSQTWAGRGATPVWLRTHLKQGGKLEEFAIAKAVGAAKSVKKAVGAPKSAMKAVGAPKSAMKAVGTPKPVKKVGRKKKR